MLTFTLADLETQNDRLTVQIAELQLQRDALRITAELLQGNTGDAVPTTDDTLDQPLQDLPPPATPSTPATPLQDDLPPNNLPIHNLEDLDIDFAGTPNLLERIKRIGNATQGHYLSLGLLTHYLEKARPSRKGSRRSLRTHIRTCISKNREHFQRVGPGIYRYYDTPRPRSVWGTDGYDHAADPEH